MASTVSMPALVCNLGGEMMYILQQRLQAQNIPAEKSVKVISDIVRTMFSSKFVSELFKAQPMYSAESTRQIFDKIAHSSIMRLSTSSMDKLYDLMTMGLKYQVISCKHPSELMQITLNHVESVRKMLPPKSSEEKLLDECVSNVLQVYGMMTAGEFMLLRQTVLQFLQTKRVKVSLFLHDGIQKQDGTIALHPDGSVPNGSDVPGTIRYFDGGNVTVSKVALPLSTACLEHNPGEESILGMNLYNRDGGGAPASNPAGTAPHPHATAQAAAVAMAAAQSKGTRPTIESAKAELDLLGTLLGAPSSAATFNLNLFPDTDVSSSGGSSVPTIVFDVAKSAASKDELSKLVQDLDIKAPAHKPAGNDLLDLMDAAGADD